MYPGRFSMPIGEAMFTQRCIRHFRPDPTPMDDIHLLMDAAVKEAYFGDDVSGPLGRCGAVEIARGHEGRRR